MVVFRYPGDERARRAAAARAARERAAKAQAALLLKQQTEWPSGNPYDGTRNYRYAARGDAGLTPHSVWDNGYSTAFVFPAQQRVPALFRIDPDGKEATADYSVHGDTVIASGTAREWRLRDGRTVMEIYDLGYNPIGHTPGTGTVSPYVQRTLKGGGNGG
jgi:type IV secretion system protein VirB9